MTVATPSDDPNGWAVIPTFGAQQWQPYEEGTIRPSEIPTGDEPGATPGSLLDPLELPQAKYSAFCGGRLARAIISWRGWMGMVQEDFGMLLVHTFGPTGHAYT
eukprot:9500188-Pyramimonas_sp.AAC.1